MLEHSGLQICLIAKSKLKKCKKLFDLHKNELFIAFIVNKK